MTYFLAINKKEHQVILSDLINNSIEIDKVIIIQLKICHNAKKLNQLNLVNNHSSMIISLKQLQINNRKRHSEIV